MNRTLPERIRALLPTEGSVTLAELCERLPADPEHSPDTPPEALREAARQAVSVMARRGLAKIVERAIGGRCARYALGREPLWQRCKDGSVKARREAARARRLEAERIRIERAAEIAERRRERDRLRQLERRRAAGVKPRADYLAELAAVRGPAKPKSNRAPARRFATEAERIAAKREYERQRSERRKAARTTQPRAAKPAKPQAQPKAKPAPKPKVQPSVFRSLATKEARAASEPRSVACAPVQVALPDSSTWTGPIERLPDGAVSKASRLRFDYRRAA